MRRHHLVRSTASLAVVAMVATCLVAASPSRPLPFTPPGTRSGDAVAAFAEARRMGRPVELPDRGSATTEVFANPAGTLTSRIHTAPVRVRRGGQWRPIDETLAVRADRTVAPRMAPVDLTFSGGGSGPLATLGRDSGRMTVGWTGPLPPPTLSGRSATYSEVWPGVDLVVESAGAGFRQTLVVKSAQAAHQARLAQLHLDIAGLTLRSVPEGIEAVDGGGSVVAAVGAARMWDSAAGADRAGPRPGTILGSVDTTVEPAVLTLRPDATMLANTGLTFPLFVDTLYRADKQHWLMVEKDLPGFGWWDSSYDARVGRDPYDSATDRFRSYFQLDTSGIIGKQIKKAIMTFDEKWRHSCDPEPVRLWHTAKVTSTTTWGDAPGPIAVLGTVVTPRDYLSCDVFTNVEFDIKALVIQNAAAGAPDLTVALVSDESATANGGKAFDNTAFIDVEYNTIPRAPAQMSTGGIGGCSPTVDSYVNSTTPELRIRLEDADAGQQVRATVEWREIGRTTATGLNTDYGVSGDERSVRPPTELGHGKRYEWRARAVNEYPGNEVDIGPWSNWCVFTVDIVPPAGLPGVTASVAIGWTEDLPVDFTFRTAGDSDVFEFQYSFNASTPVRVRAVSGAATVRLEPVAGFNTLTVAGVDRAGNVGVRTASVSQNAQPLPDLTGYWPMDDWDAVAMDVMGGNDATIEGGYQWVEGYNGGALNLDGRPDTQGQTASAVVRTDASFTVMAWVQLTDDSEWRTVLSQAGTNHYGFLLQFDSVSHRWMFAMRPGDDDAAVDVTAYSGVSAQVGVWTHLAGVYDRAAGELRLYVNGLLSGKAAYGHTWNATGPMLFGYSNWYGFDVARWSGGLDDVKIYSFAASPRKIRLEVPPDQGGPRGWWTFDEGTGNAASDSGYQGHVATLTSGATWTGGRLGAGGLHLSGEGAEAYTGRPVVRTEQSFTVAAWVRLERDDSWFSAVSQDGVYASGFSLEYSLYPRGWLFSMSGADRVDNASNTAYALSDTRPQVGVWTYLAGVYDRASNQIRLYVNGRLAGSATFNGGPAFDGGLHIGRSRNNGWPVNWWPGDLDEVQTTDQALSAADLNGWMLSDESHGPSGHWALDESAGAISADALPGNGNTVAIMGGAGRVTGRVGKALHLTGDPDGWDGRDGTYAYTAGPVVRTNRSFTAAAWVKLDRLDLSSTAVSQDGAFDSGFELRYDAPTRRWMFAMSGTDGPGDDPAASVSSPVLPRVGGWTHLAGTYDAVKGELKLYVDGALAGSTPYKSTWNATGALQIGRGLRNGLFANWFFGDVDEVRVTDVPMAPEQIRSLLITTPIGPGGWWRMDETGGGSAFDATGNGHQLSLVGNAAWWPVGRCGGALKLGGSGRAEAPQSLMRTDGGFTVAAWVRLDATTANATAVSQLGSMASAFQLGFSATQKKWSFVLPTADTAGGSRATVLSTSVAKAETWVHLVGVYDATNHQARLYVDGQLQGTVTATAFDAGGALQIGRAKVNGAFAEDWRGVVDEVRGLQRAATLAEIQQMVATCDDIGPAPLPAAGRYQLRFAGNDMCLSQYPGADGYLYQQPDCASQWLDVTVEPSPDGTYRLLLDGWNCVGVQAGSTNAGAVLEMDDCSQVRGQYFRIEPVTSPRRGYVIRAVHSGQCVSTEGNSAAAGARLAQMTCSPTAVGQVLEFDGQPARATYLSMGPYAIPDAATVDLRAEVAGFYGSPATVKVDVDIRHTCRGDLQIDLIAPSGRLFALKAEGDGCADNVVGTYTVNTSGEPANGLWMLRVRDHYGADVGQVASWSLTLR